MKLIKTRSFELAIVPKGDSQAERLALVLPGRLDTKDYIHMTSHGDYLASRGFYAVSFDPPCTWDSPGDIMDYSTTNYLKAVNELIEYFGNRPTLLLGHSRGGAVAMLASDNPSVKWLVLAMASYRVPTPPDPKTIHGNYAIDYRDVPPGKTRSVEKIEFKTPMNYFREASKFDQTKALQNFKGTKAVICGYDDEFIKPGKVKAIYDTLSEPKSFLELSCSHDYRLYPEAIKAVNRAIGKILDNEKS